MTEQNGPGIGRLSSLAADAEFAKVFSSGVVKIMEEAIAHLPLRDRIAALEAREHEREAVKRGAAVVRLRAEDAKDATR
jgi:hypothetical protein